MSDDINVTEAMKARLGELEFQIVVLSETLKLRDRRIDELERQLAAGGQDATPAS